LRVLPILSPSPLVCLMEDMMKPYLLFPISYSIFLDTYPLYLFSSSSFLLLLLCCSPPLTDIDDFFLIRLYTLSPPGYPSSLSGNQNVLELPKENIFFLLYSPPKPAWDLPYVFFPSRVVQNSRASFHMPSFPPPTGSNVP